MRLVLRYFFLSGIALTVPSFALLVNAQERCGTVSYSKILRPDYQTYKVEFEKWIVQHALPRRSTAEGRQQAAPYKIPVVVHVIHNGEPIGTGANISDAQIMSQIRVLNEDFRRENADASSTPSAFAAVAGSLDIEFVLARQNPDGMPTNGIMRINGGRNGWTINDNYTLKALSYWPAERYMNIWVCNLTDSFVGYAQHPESTLPGLENSSTNRLTDGVVIWYRAFGSEADGDFNLDPVFNKGRTTTHEVGHFFGLNHIWGDDAQCAGTDYVTDTPNQGNRTTGCPTHPKADDCGQAVMFQNFLDYTDDNCMNLFTQGQVDRMTIVLENSPRRHSLLTSPGIEEPDPLPNDIGLRTVVFPDASVCSNSITPVIEVRNYGNNVITSVRIRLVVDGIIEETKDFSLALSPQESINLSFASLTIPSGAHSISFQVLLTNGGADGGTYNDQKSSTVLVPTFSGVPFAHNLTTSPPGWITQNPDGQVTWQIAAAPSDVQTNKALKLDYFNYEDKIGEIDVFVSPVLDLSTVPAATLTFEVAHARYRASNDRLQVIALTNCGDITEGTILYNKAGDALKTAPPISVPFTPSSAGQWRKELIDLSGFVGTGKLQLAFVGINDWGNNIFVDNITLFTEQTRDVSLVRMISPSFVTCAEEVAPRLLVQNSGSVLLNDLVVEYSLNGGPLQSLAFSNLNIAFGVEKEIQLPPMTLEEGENTINVSLKHPGGLTDINPENNDAFFPVVVNHYRDKIPLRQNFDNNFTPEWTTINPENGMNWQPVATNFGQSLYFNAFDNTAIDDEAWLVSPVLDFSGATEASMLFDLSYRSRAGAEETLTILASTDCGVSYQPVSYNFPDIPFTDESWVPAEEDDWTQDISVNLNTVAGVENVRIAFVVRNQNGNNLYLDNIEFFVSGDANPVEVEEPYSIYGYNLSEPQESELKITFNLTERQDVRFSIVNAMGQMETDGILSDVLNQTFPLNLPERLAPGIYFIRVEIDGKFHSSKVLVF